MIKGRIGRCLAWLLAGVILLASCKTGRSDPPRDSAEETSGQSPSGALELIRDGKAGCGIVRQSSVGKDVMTLCSELFGAVHTCEWLAWEPDEIGIICLYVMYIPMMIGLMVKAKDLGFFRRFLLPGLGLLCCLFFCYAIWNGYGAKTCCGFLIFFAVVMFIGYLVKGKTPEKVENTESAEQTE